jgi:hypothetical protein
MAESKPIIAILRAGPITSRGPKGPETNVPFVIEIETPHGSAILQVGPQATAILAEEMATYLSLHKAKKEVAN